MIGAILGAAMGNVAGSALGGMTNAYGAQLAAQQAALNLAPGGFIQYQAGHQPPQIVYRFRHVCAYCERGRAARDTECEGCGALETKP